MGNQKGFSLLEAFISITIGGAFLSSVIGAWYFSTKTWKEESIRSTLRVGIEQAMERIKEDVRLSDGSSILFYPANAATYTAISLPRATPGASGYLAFSGGNIAWDKTVIYHVFNNGGNVELRRTVFDSFKTSASERQADLDAVAVNGTGGAGSTTRAIFSSGGTALEIVPQSQIFDGYGAVVARSPLTSFGSAKLSAGTHEIRFETTGKNASSSGYGIGLDSLSLTPSGGSREAEAMTLAGSSGQAMNLENMTLYAGLWDGNFQRDFQAGGTGHYFTLDAYYDLWLESNFGNMTHLNTQVFGTNPTLMLSSRETQSLTSAWLASSQTLSGTQANEALSTTQSVRSVINGSFITKPASMIRVKFTASSTTDALVINSAYFGLRSGTEALGNGSPDFAGLPTLLYFDNAPVLEGGVDPAGAVGAGLATSVTVPAGHHVWSNWFTYSISATPPVPDFLVSMNVSSGSGATTWTQTQLPLPVYSYRIDDASGTNVALSPWTPAMPGYSTTAGAFASVEMATWESSGTATSQVYDTKVTSPSYGQLSWTSSLPLGSIVTLKIRSANNSDMSDATTWNLLPNYSVSPVPLGAALPSKRYVQFQAAFQAAPPYLTYPYIDDLQITWPGQTTLVELTGHYTLKPNYGMFRVLVDGSPAIKGLEIKLTASQDYRGKTYVSSLNAEEKAKNTGK